MFKDKIFIVLFILAIATRFFYFNFPGEVVFDEVHFGKFVRSYFTGENYFDIHPPHGKLLIFGIAKIGGFKITEDFNKIGQNYDQNNLFALRFLPTLISSLFIPLIYLLVLEITNSRRASFFSAFLVLFDNAILTQSRFALLDIFLLFFGILAIYLYLLQEKTDLKKQKIWLLIFSGLSLGISYSIKWTGLSSVLLIGIIAACYLFKNTPHSPHHLNSKNKQNVSISDEKNIEHFKKWGYKIYKFFINLTAVYLISLIVYIAGFAIHFTLLIKPGPGDAYFSSDFKNLPFLEKFLEINKKMFSYNKNIKNEHPFASSWYQWPLNQKRIFYWQKEKQTEKIQELNLKLENLKNQLTSDPQNLFTTQEEIMGIEKEISNFNKIQQIWLIGNLIVWCLGLIGLVSTIILIFIKLISKKPADFNLVIPLFLVIAWAVNFLPFISITRPLFLYHYFFSLIFSIILFGFLFDYLIKKIPVSENYKKLIGAIIIFIVVGNFLIIAPLSFGLNFSPGDWYLKIISYLI